MSDSARGSYYHQENPAYRTALVHALEVVPPYRVRVQFPDRDNLISWWLPVVVPKIQNDKFFWQPDIGEQVAVLMDANDEDGIVIGSVPSMADQAPPGLGPSNYYVGFADGTVIQYNRQTHQLSITLGLGGQATISTAAGGAIELDALGNLELRTSGSISFSQGPEAATDTLALVSKLVAAFNEHTHPSNGAPPTVPWLPETVSSGLVKTSG